MRIRLALALSVVFCGCGRNRWEEALARRPAQRIVAKEVAPAICRWGSAQVEVSVYRSPSPRDDGYHWQVMHSLVLPDPAPALLPFACSNYVAASEEHLKLYDTEIQLKFTPDGRAVCVGTEPWTSWSVAYLDAGSRPVWMTTLSTRPGDDPVPMVPSTREAVRQVLGDHMKSRGHLDARTRIAAVEYVAAHTEDGELVDLVARELPRPEWSDFPSSFEPECLIRLQEGIRNRPEARRLVHEAVRSWITSPCRGPDFAPILLETCDDPDTRILAATALRVGSADPALCTLSIRWLALLERTSEVPVVPARMEETLVRVLESDQFAAKRIEAMRALWTLDTEHARSALKSLADEAEPDVEAPEWPLTHAEFRRKLRGNSKPPEVWARSAIQSRPVRR